MSSEGARGFMDIETPAAEREQLEMSLATQKEVLELQIKKIDTSIGVCKEQFGEAILDSIEKKLKNEQSTYFRNELEKFRALVIERKTIAYQLLLVTNDLVQRTDETFETMFLRQAKNLLPPEKYSQITNYAHSQLKELYEQV